MEASNSSQSAVSKLRDTIRGLRTELRRQRLQAVVAQLANTETGLDKIAAAVKNFIIRYDDETEELCLPGVSDGEG